MIRFFATLLFFVSASCIAFLIGSNEIGRFRSKKALENSFVLSHIEPKKEFPITENKSFAIVVYAHNAASWCERALHSLFEQDYDDFRVLFIDDGSLDKTFEVAQQFVIDNHLEERVVAVRNEEKIGMTACFYRAAQICLDKEIMIPLVGSNWFAHHFVLQQFNQAFQNPDVWIAYGETISYPTYSINKVDLLDQTIIAKEGTTRLIPLSATAFYSGLFKSIHLSDLFDGKGFCPSELSWQMPLLEQSGGRWRKMLGPLIFENKAHLGSERFHQRAISFERLSSYRPLEKLPLPSLCEEGSTDIVVFSRDRPLQLFSAIESIERYMQGRFTIHVLYRASDTRYEAAYEEVFAAYPEITGLKERHLNGKDFQPLFEKILFDSNEKYILLTTDDVVMKDFADLSLCQTMLEKTHAYGFYLGFGNNIERSYLSDRPLPKPLSAELGNGVYVWNFSFGSGDWGVANHIEMGLYRKEELKRSLASSSYRNPHALQEQWVKNLPNKKIGLCFECSKALNLPLNSTCLSGHPNMNCKSLEELLAQFNLGYKMNIDPLFQVNNPAPHYDWVPELIER